MPLSDFVSLSLALATVVLLAALQQIEACSCVIQHPQSVFCQADFVLKATVIAKAEVYDENEEGSGEVIPYIRYQLEVIQPFKLHPELEMEEQIYVYTGSGMWSCSVLLEEEQTYVILGHMVDGMPHLLPCGGHQAWDSLTSRMMRGYRFLYAQHCNCTIEVSYAPREYMGDELPEDRCFWFFREDPHFCFASQGLCKRRDDQCKWSRTDPFRNCLNQEEEGSYDSTEEVTTPEVLDEEDSTENEVINNDTLIHFLEP